ncbi:MAG: hypothetical protein ETSY1_02230 [Candidatus Entotheonella factor]|uniref:Uncharacterized protein n=1 Tax=Entotheonella factor TaxID=1429438 RepID=W4LZM4_ENTF1|nr:MAG: hypothetical protein ETSY1_02230 [Candidatus Entotheonella factor]
MKTIARQLTLWTLILAIHMGGSAFAQSWSEHVIYSPVAATDNVVTVSLTALPQDTALQREPFYVAYEVDNGSTRSLYIKAWTGSPPFTPAVLIDSGLDGIYNPSITARLGHVTIAAHYQVPTCASGVLGLKEYDYDVKTGVIDSLRVIDAGAGCISVGHSHIVWSPGDSTYHVCWTRKVGGITGDEVLCARRAATDSAWGYYVNISNNAANDQDHATIAIKPSGNYTRRIAYHDATTNSSDDTHEAILAMFKPSDARVDYLVPNGSASPQSGWQDRPFIVVDADRKMHVVWEDGPLNDEVIKYVRCVNGTPGGCDQGQEWEFNNVAISEPGIDWARSPHMAIRYDRAWISYEQRLLNAAVNKEVMVLHRCKTAALNQAWARSDPYPADDRNEFTEEYGTPHIAVRAGVTSNGPHEVGTVALREIPGTTQLGTGFSQYEAILYTALEPSCP